MTTASVQSEELPGLNPLDTTTAYLPDAPQPYRITEDTAKIGKDTVHCTRFIPFGTEKQPASVIYGGFMGLEGAYYGLAKVMACLGQPAVTVEHAPGDLIKPELTHARYMLAALQRTAELQDTPQVDGIFHSMAGFILAVMRRNHPNSTQLLRQAHLIAPAGITADTTGSLGAKLPTLFSVEIIPAFLQGQLPFIFKGRTLRQGAHYLKSPWRLWSEGTAVSNCQIHDDLRTIRQDGTIVTVMWLSQDSLFNPQEGHYHTSRPATPVLPALADYSEILRSTDAGHNAPIHHTQSEVVGRRVVQLTRHHEAQI